jgi:hypothetical protein
MQKKDTKLRRPSKCVAYRFTAKAYICLRLGKENRDTVYKKLKHLILMNGGSIWQRLCGLSVQAA